MTNWSPLTRIADLPRALPGLTAGVGADWPDAPRTGEFWTAGNVGAMGLEVRDHRTRFRLGLHDVSGAYRRPLDPAGVGQATLSASGWTSLGRGVAAAGNVVVDGTSFKDSLFADVLLPYGSNPLIVADTLGDPMRRRAVRLEGAIGIHSGRLGAGLALGWEGQSNRSVASPVPRLNRTAGPGLAAGLSYDCGPLRLGVLGRWLHAIEYVNVRTVAQSARVFQINGYAEPVPLDFYPGQYERRFERDGHAAGASGAFQALGTRWTLYGLRERITEDRFFPSQSTELPRDTWNADGWVTGGAGQRAFIVAKTQLLVTLESKYRTLAGEALEADVGDIVVLVDDSRLDISLDVRARLAGGWHAGGRAEFRRSAHDRLDRLVVAGSEVRANEGGVSVEIGRMLGERWGIATAAGIASYGPAGLLPDPRIMGPQYKRYLGPGLALELSRAIAASGAVSARWIANETTAIWMRTSVGALRPRQGDVRIPLTPEGSRRSWSLSVGVDRRPGAP